ncbi:9847_t:CDS:1, partial [Rhizophagus irregularis]
TSIDAFMKCPVPNIPKAFYDLVEAFYYSLLASVECPEGQEKAILENRS